MNIEAFKTATTIVGGATFVSVAIIGLVFFSVSFFTNPVFAFLFPIAIVLIALWALIYWVESGR
jgi:hypothetical protein